MKASYAIGIAFAALLAAPSAQAQSSWTTTAGGSYQWASGTNWTTNPAPPNAVGAVANVTAAAAGTETITVVADTVGTLNVGSTSGGHVYNIAGGTLTLNNGGSGATIAENSTASGDAISSAISMADSNATTALTISNASSHTFTIGGGITSTGTGSNLLLDANSTGGITLQTTAINNSGTITNSGTGAGIVTISTGVGSNVTGITETGSTSELLISGLLTTNASGTTLTSTTTGGTELFDVTGGIGGSGNLTLDANGSNTFATGGIKIETGTVSTTGAILNSGSGSSTVFITSNITAASSVEENGTSALILGGTNSYSGNTTLQSGEVGINSATALGTGTFIINGGSIDQTSVTAGITMTNNNAQTWNGNFAWIGTKPLTFGNGAITLGGNVTLTTQTHGSQLTENGDISGTGNLIFNDNSTDGPTLAGGVNNTGTITNSGTSTGTTTISGNVGSNVGLITENSAGSALVLSGTNTNVNGVTLTNGTLKLGSATALGATASTLNIGGGTLDSTVANLDIANANAQNWNASFAFAGTNNLDLGTGAVSLTVTPTVTTTAGTLTEDGAIGGAFGLTKAGSGTLALTGASGYTGVTTVSAGVLSFTSIQNVGGGASALGAPTTGVNGTISLGGGTLQYVGSSNGSSNRVINLTTSTSAVDASGTATLALSGGINGTNKNITLQGSGLGIESGAVATGSGTLTKTGTGTWTLAGGNTYTGATTVSNGTLIVSGSTASGSAVAINSGGTLAGDGLANEGTLNGTVTVATGTPGGAVNLQDGAIGTLHVGALTLNGGTLSFDVGAGSSGNLDLIASTGTLTIGGATKITIGFVNGTPSLTDGTYSLITYTGTALTTAQFNDLSLSSTTLGAYTLQLINGSSGSTGVELQISGGGATNGQYTLTTTATSLNVHANGGTTTLSTTFANTGTSPQDSLNYNTLTATGAGVGAASGTTSGGPIAPGASGPGSATNTFTATTAGNVVISNSASVSNASASGTPSPTNTGVTLNVYSGLSTWTGTGASGAWGSITTSFGSNWGANQGSPGVTSGFTGVDTATFGAVSGHTAVTVNLNDAAPNLNSITFSSPATSYNLAQGSNSNSITLSGTTPSINVTTNATAGAQTISAPIVLGANTSLAVGSNQQLTISGAISGSSYGLSTATVANGGGGTTIFTSDNTYGGGLAVSGGTTYINNGGGASFTAPTTGALRPITATNSTGSGTGTGSVTVNSGGTLAGSGTIAPTSGGVTINSGGTLSSGASQSAYAYSKGGNGSVNGTGTGGGLTINNSSNLSSALVVNGGATLTFALGSGTAYNGGSGALDFAAPNTNSTYLSIAGNTADQIFSDTTTADNIDLVDLTNGAPAGSVSLTLRAQNPYLLIQTALGDNSDFSNLWTTGGEGKNGYVLGISTGTGNNYVAFDLAAYDINGNLISSTTNLQNLRLYLYNGDLEVVPEPGTWALMVGGLALLVFIQRRKSRVG